MKVPKKLYVYVAQPEFLTTHSTIVPFASKQCEFADGCKEVMYSICTAGTPEC